MGHWYNLTGEACHFVKAKDGHSRPSTLRDAKREGWVPGVTEVLKVAARPALERWKIAQAAIAVLTSPRVPGEDLDAFCERVLFADKEQDEEAAKAADLGSRIHGELEHYFKGGMDVVMWEWIGPVAKSIANYGKVHAVETILIGNGYGGMCDLILEAPECWWLFDWKTTKKLPQKGAWDEHVIQCAAYAAAFQDRSFAETKCKPIRTANCYISTVEQGKFVVCEHDPDWQKVYNSAFLPLLQYWQWVNA